jgi:hypothetical protein
MSKPLVIIASAFQVIGIVWGIIDAFQNNTLKSFFAGPNWPIYLGFVLLLVAVIQSFAKDKKPESLSKDNQFLP